MNSFLITSIISFISIMIAVAFFTLLERKTLSYMQMRKGPNKVSIGGLPQPMADAIKLFTKQSLTPSVANQPPFLIAPAMSLMIALMLWQTFPMKNTQSFLVWGTLLFLCLSALNVYGTLIAGWSSNSKYALIGALRAVAQTISYEVSMSLIILSILFISYSFSLNYTMETFMYIWSLLLMAPMAMIWFSSCAAETNRAPFDFAEGESELVSGFNIEYGGAGFALIFLAEYANIILMSMITATLFIGGMYTITIQSELLYSVKITLLCFTFIWIRATYPRFRYDRLMYLTWKGFLPTSLTALTLIIIIQMNLFI
uniref:NADH-ubiquinone oxidoreductase chain 1 n=1 Tax=Eulepetopsis sp. TaxID=3071118 RepID=A0AA96HVR6_9GAST|nr:NADH dehydrogenase subunit 1 [Eulepetopsis sp.]